MEHTPIAVPIATASGGGGGRAYGGGHPALKVGDHEVRLSFSDGEDGDGLVIAATNALTGDRFETTLTTEAIEKGTLLTR